MATESVATAPAVYAVPRSFTAMDSSVYLGWIQAMGEVMMNVRANDVIESRAVANYGGLILALAEAAEQLADEERAGMQAWRSANPVEG